MRPLPQGSSRRRVPAQGIRAQVTAATHLLSKQNPDSKFNMPLRGNMCIDFSVCNTEATVSEIPYSAETWRATAGEVQSRA